MRILNDKKIIITYILDFGTKPEHNITEQFGGWNSGAWYPTLEEDCPNTQQPSDN